MADLKNVTTRELYAELFSRSRDYNSDVLSVQLWLRDDVMQLTENPREVDSLMERREAVCDLMTVAGWEILENLLS